MPDPCEEEVSEGFPSLAPGLAERTCHPFQHLLYLQMLSAFFPSPIWQELAFAGRNCRFCQLSGTVESVQDSRDPEGGGWSLRV